MFVKFKKTTKRYFDKVIFRDLDMLLSADRKIGIIGDNGSGKTTILKLISGIDIPNAGTIEISPPSTTFAYIMSDHDLISTYDSPYEFLLPEGIAELYGKIFIEGSVDPEVYQEFDDLSGYDVLNRLEKELKIFGIQIEDLTKTFDHLSSGERLKMQFAKFSSTPYDAILFDEPTATLDKEGKEFLYGFLETWHKFCLIASHDRKILNKFCKQIILVEKGTITSYTGNYDDYVRFSTEEANRIDDDNKIVTRKINSLAEESDNIFDVVNTKVHVLKDNDKMSFHYKIARKNSKGLRKVDVINKKVLRLRDEIVEVEDKPMSEKLYLDLRPPKSKEIIKAQNLKLQDRKSVV